MKTYKVVSLFCGAGGLDIGFSRAGFNTIWANDNCKAACETFKLWSPTTEVVCAPIDKIPLSSIPDCDVILGGFPCQGFSTMGCRRVDDPRNKLYLNYVEIVKRKQPLAFVGENVKGLLSMNGGQTFLKIIEDFASCGYKIYYKLMNARYFNVPQDRKRVIIVGLRKDIDVPYFKYPKPCDKLITIAEALKDFPEPSLSDVQPLIPTRVTKRYMQRNKRRDWNDVSFTIQAHENSIPLHPSSPDMILLKKGYCRFGDGVSRRFSYQECAALQTFPRNMKICGNSLRSKYRQVGNAVPCNLAEAIAHSLYDCLIHAGK